MAEKHLVLDVHENPKKISEWLLFAIQHVLAVLVATITVPLLVPGMPIVATMVSAGIGTLFYNFVTKSKSPVFLSSSFAYIAPMSSAIAVSMVGNAGGYNYLALILGMMMVGIIYVSVALVIKKFGTGWLNKILPPVVAGPVIMVIGLSLAGSAINNLTNVNGGAANYNLIHILCGLIALFVTAFAAHYGRKNMLGLIPFVLGMGSGYVSAVLFTVFGSVIGGNDYFAVVNFQPLVNIFTNFDFSSIFNYKMFVPNSGESFIFLRFEEIAKFDWAQIGQVALLFVPVSFVTICEHTGDHKNLGNIIGKDLLGEEPGMQRTLIGDGVATAISGALCGAANTTYGESVAVVGTTKVASVNVLRLAALMMIVFGLFTPFTALLQTIPACVTGGVSVVLYGFIASSGVKMIMNKKVDFNVTRNIFIAAAILVSGIGGLTLKFGDVSAPTIQITSTAVAMILGIILNFVLKEKNIKE
jgi:uracil permease